MYLNRQTKLNQQLVKKVPDLVLAGLSDNGIARQLGVNLTTFRNWLEIGEHADPVECSPIHRMLYLEYSSAKSELEENLVSGIIKTRDWRAKAWILERQFRDDYNPRVNDLITQQIDQIVSKVSSLMSEESFNEFINALSLAQNSYLPETETEGESEDSDQAITIEVIPTRETERD